MSQPHASNRSHTPLDQESTLIAVIEMSQSSWLVAAIVPGIARHPLKKINPDETMLLGLLRRWQDEAAQAGRTITRIAVAYEAGRDGFWLQGNRANRLCCDEAGEVVVVPCGHLSPEA